MKILLVDDETAILDTLEILFRREGWDVTVADSGPKALAALDDAPDTLIIHAMRRPMSGLLNLAAHRGVRRVCYLAPSAPSLGRDLAECEQYRLEELIYLDQMPGTATLMTMALLSLDVDAAPLAGEDSTRA